MRKTELYLISLLGITQSLFGFPSLRMEDEKSNKYPYEIWINEEPLAYVTKSFWWTGSGYPFVSGRNHLKIFNFNKELRLGVDLKLFEYEDYLPVPVKIDKNGLFRISGEFSSDQPKIITDDLYDLTEIKEKVGCVLKAMASGERDCLFEVFKGDSEQLQKIFPNGLFTQSEWKKREFCNISELVVKRGRCMILVYCACDNRNMLVMNSENFNFELPSMQLFYNNHGNLSLFMFTPDNLENDVLEIKIP